MRPGKLHLLGFLEELNSFSVTVLLIQILDSPACLPSCHTDFKPKSGAEDYGTESRPITAGAFTTVSEYYEYENMLKDIDIGQL